METLSAQKSNRQKLWSVQKQCPETKSKKAIKEKKTRFYRNILSSKDSKEIWKVINRILNPNMSTLQADPYALNEFFNKMAERLAGQNATSDGVVLSHIDLVTSSHGSYKIQKSNIQWRSQVSQITTKILFNWIWQHPSFLYQTNSRIHCLTFPDQWKIVRISLIPKVINTTELKDYRSISILLILSKVFEKQVLHQITDFIETEQSYNKHQSGYHKNRSAATILSKLYNDIKMAMQQSEVTIAVFTNYSKAFDTIDFFTLIQKMHSLNFSMDFLHWVI